MRDILSLLSFPATGSDDRDRTWLPGLPHAIAALATIPIFGSAAGMTGIALAALASFVVFLPVTALSLNGGRPIGPDDDAPALTPTAHAALFAAWSVTAWAMAWLASAG